MRDWDRVSKETTDAGASLWVVTPDTPDLARRMAADKGLRAPFISGDEALWARWGLTNPRRPTLPHPATVVIAPGGEVVLLDVHENYKQRSKPEEVIERIAKHRASGQTAPKVALPVDHDIDWDGALTLGATRRGSVISLTLVLADGFHAYGAKEPNARPLAARVNGEEEPLHVPDGERMDLGGGLGEAWVLTGTQIIEGRVRRGPDALKGEIDVQLCTEAACSPPRTLSWTAQ